MNLPAVGLDPDERAAAHNLRRVATHGRTEVALVAAMFAAVTTLRFALPSSVSGVNFLYVVPISPLALRIGWRGGVLGAAGAMVGVAAWQLTQDTALEPADIVIRGIVFGLVGTVVGVQRERRRKLEAELSLVAVQDTLTGLPNRRGWYERLAEELARARRSRKPLTLLAVDLDRLKHINDTHGHAAGDRFIVDCATAWKQSLRSTDFIARVGGDAFLALLPDCSDVAARLVIERAFRAGPPGNPFSVGLAVWDGYESATELVHRADEALYVAKRAGGGRIAGRTGAFDSHAVAAAACDAAAMRLRTTRARGGTPSSSTCRARSSPGRR